MTCWSQITLYALDYLLIPPLSEITHISPPYYRFSPKLFLQNRIIFKFDFFVVLLRKNYIFDSKYISTYKITLTTNFRNKAATLNHPTTSSTNYHHHQDNTATLASSYYIKISWAPSS